MLRPPPASHDPRLGTGASDGSLYEDLGQITRYHADGPTLSLHAHSDVVIRSQCRACAPS